MGPDDDCESSQGMRILSLRLEGDCQGKMQEYAEKNQADTKGVSYGNVKSGRKTYGANHLSSTKTK